MGNKNAKAKAPVLRQEDLDAIVKTSGMSEQEVGKKHSHYHIFYANPFR